MNAPRKYRPLTPLWFNRLLRWTYGRWLRRAYNIRVGGLALFDTLKPPYVLIPNHVSLADPFVVGGLVPDPVHWITGDGNMRSTVMRTLLSLVGSIPKSKAIPDLETVGTIVRVVRKSRGVVGIFAEGQSTWNGATQPIYPSTAKLLSLLKVPVVVPVLKGMYLSAPRWGQSRRRGRVEVEFKLVLSAEDCGTLNPEEIHRRLEDALRHDEYTWLKGQEEIRYNGHARAVGLERGFFLCPRCGTLGSLRSAGNRISCVRCGAAARYTRRGTLAPVADATHLGPGTLREWDAAQGPAFAALLRERNAERPAGPLLEDTGALLFKGKRFSPLVGFRSGRLQLFADRLVFAPDPGEPLTFALPDMEGLGTLKSRILEFYVGRTYYRLRFINPRISARKWQAAVEFLTDDEPVGRRNSPGRAFYA